MSSVNPHLAMTEDAEKLALMESERQNESIPLEQLYGKKSEAKLERELEARQKGVDHLTTLAEKVNIAELFD